MPNLFCVDPIAQVCHEAIRSYCRSIGDRCNPTWDDAEEWQKVISRLSVRAILENPEITPEQIHNKWCQQRRADGWVYGPVKDEDAKEHPCLVPYDELPEAQRTKDTLFGAIVRSLMPKEEVTINVTIIEIGDFTPYIPQPSFLPNFPFPSPFDKLIGSPWQCLPGPFDMTLGDFPKLDFEL